MRIKGSFDAIAASKWVLRPAFTNLSPFRSNDRRILDLSCVSQREETLTLLMVG